MPKADDQMGYLDKTREWMESNLKGKTADLAIAKFGSFMEKTQRGDEPTLDEIQRAMKE